MIRSFRSRALERFWTKNDARKLNADWIARIGILLDRLDASKVATDMNLPGFDFHQLRGSKRDRRYAVSVSGNWRITFGWDESDAVDVDLEDYH